jgi:hypothetical protein
MLVVVINLSFELCVYINLFLKPAYAAEQVSIWRYLVRISLKLLAVLADVLALVFLTIFKQMLVVACSVVPSDRLQLPSYILL